MSEYVGKMACSLCGNVCGVKKSEKGRMTLVCKWQDGGCGSQLQTLTADAGMHLMKKMMPLQEEAKPEKVAEHVPEREPVIMPKKPPKQENKADGFGGFF